MALGVKGSKAGGNSPNAAPKPARKGVTVTRMHIPSTGEIVWKVLAIALVLIGGPIAYACLFTERGRAMAMVREAVYADAGEGDYANLSKTAKRKVKNQEKRAAKLNIKRR